MSFYPQPNKYQCGPFALKYALIVFGIFKDENRIAQIAGSTWWAGTDEIGLAKAAKRFHCQMTHFSSENKIQALKLLNERLKRNYPCILSVDNWEHWFTVVNFTGDKYVIIDSGLEKVIAVLSPQKLLERWIYYDELSTLVSFDGYSIVPKFKAPGIANFTLEKARIVMQKKNASLAFKWDEYFEDLIYVCQPRSSLSYSFISMPEFLKRHETTLVNRVSFWHGMPSKTEIKQILRNFAFVASVYNLVIHEDDEKKALVDFSSLLMMYACGKYGMDPVY
jgi:hypothetical protein